MGANFVSWVEFRSSDAQRAAEFYSRIFGWQTLQIAEGYVVFNAGQGPGGGFNSTKPEMPQTLAYIHVESIEETGRQIEAAGGKIVVPKALYSPEAGYIAFFQDPEGNIVGLSESYRG